MPNIPKHVVSRMIIATLATLTATTVALAQDQIYAPCLNTSGDTAAIDAGFIAAGWTPLTDPAARTAALWTLGEASYVVRLVPPTPASAAALSSDMAAARADAADRFRGQTVFRRDTTVALYYFPFSPDLSALNCMFSGPSLPEAAAILDSGSEVKTNADLTFLTSRLTNPTVDIAEITVDATRYAPAFPIDPPITGLESMFVRVKAAAAP